MEKEEISKKTTIFDGAFLRKLDRLAILSKKVMAGQLQGERRSPKRGQSVEFSDFRPYVAGDDFRRIDWNAFARLERFFIKLYVEEEDLNVHLLIDTSNSMNWGNPTKFWYATRAAAALGYIALAGLDRVSITTIGDGASGQMRLPSQRGKAQARELFKFLVNLNPGGTTRLGKHLQEYAAKTRLPGPLFLFTDLLEEGWKDGLRAVAGRGFEITILHILAPDEINPELDGELRLIDSETGSMVEVTAEMDFIHRYRRGFEAWIKDVRHFCSARRIHYIQVDTSLAFEELLFEWLIRQEVIR